MDPRGGDDLAWTVRSHLVNGLHPPSDWVDDLAARFTARAILHAEWTHTAHLVVGAWHVHRYGPDEALARMRVGIRALNDAHGTPNSPTRGYHETVTRAYVVLLAEMLGRCPLTMPLADRVARVLASPIADKEALLAFYSRERLMSSTARAEWVEPDLAPLSRSLD
jgi:hypothetical protein